MKTINKLIAMAFLCLTITNVFAGAPNPNNGIKPVVYKKMRVKVTNVKNSQSCYADIYVHDNGPGTLGGVTGEILSTFVSLVTNSGPSGGANITVSVPTTFTLSVMLGPAGNTTSTNIQYTINTGQSISVVKQVVTQRAVSSSDVTGYSYYPDGSSSGLYIDLNAYNPFSY